MKILVTGSAAFIGYHLIIALLCRDFEVVGLDSINEFYDPTLKLARLEECGIDRGGIKWHQEAYSSKYPRYRFIKMNIEDKSELIQLCKYEKFDIIVNLAAQVGIRYSILNPDAYAQSNLVVFLNILEASRCISVKHLVYASSSSVYGLNETMPFSFRHDVDHPVSLYAASKKAKELMVHSYSHLYRIPTSGLLFFTVYGHRGILKWPIICL